MKRKERVRRTASITFAVTAAELHLIKEGHAGSIYRKRSEYLRALLVDQKVRMYYRNGSFDDFISEGVKLRKLLQLIRETASNERLIVLIEEVKEIMTKIYELCKPR